MARTPRTTPQGGPGGRLGAPAAPGPWRVYMAALGVYRIGCARTQTWHPVARTFGTAQAARDFLTLEDSP